MNQTSALNDDLQKAIEDITKSTNMDPVFADPVAAPTPMPPKPTTPKPMSTPMPTPQITQPIVAEASAEVVEPIVPVEPTIMPPVEVAPAPITEPTPAPVPMPEPIMAPEPMTAPEPVLPAEPTPAPIAEPVTETAVSATSADLQEVKQAALRDLTPLLEQLDVDPSQKFNLYKNVITDLGDSSVVSPAYRAATGITDDRERGEALLYLINTIDNM